MTTPARQSTVVERGLRFGPIVLHAVLVYAVFADPASLATRPIRNVDYGSHYYVTTHVADHVRQLGRLWGYDPFWMAGYPDGLVGLVDSKHWYPLVWLAPEGLEAFAFNLGILIALLAAPVAVGRAASATGADPREAAAAAVGSTVITFTFPLATLFWTAGGLAFFLASLLAVPAAIALGRALANESPDSGGRFGALALGLAASTVHAGILPVLAAGALAGAAAIRSRPGLAARRLAIAGAVLVLPVLPALVAFARLGPQLLPAPGKGFLAGGVVTIAVEWGSQLFQTAPGWTSGPGGFLAIAVLAACAPGRRSRASAVPRIDAARSALHAAVIACGLLAVSSTIVPALELIQPQRYLLPLALFLCIPAGKGFLRLARAPHRFRSLVPLAIAAVAIAEGACGSWPSLALGHGVDETEDRLVDYLRNTTHPAERILVESSWIEVPAAAGSDHRIVLKRFNGLPLRLDRELIGSAALAPITAHRYARFGRGKILGSDLAELDGSQLAALLRLHAIGTVVACHDETLATLEASAGIFGPPVSVGDCEVRPVREPERSRFLEGVGVVEARVDRIDVRDAVGERLVLRYHWLPTLHTEPPLPVSEAPQSGTPVGFIAIEPGGVRDFTILP